MKIVLMFSGNCIQENNKKKCSLKVAFNFFDHCDNTDHSDLMNIEAFFLFTFLLLYLFNGSETFNPI